MCGIAGSLSLDGRPLPAGELRAMCAAMAHRGPDDDGFHVTPAVGLGMRRLKIIDLATGHQPIRNEDGTVWIVFNGEIYNYAELRCELQARGHTFYTATDTETIVHLYEQYGEACVEKLRGMFTFALWDDRRQTLLLARDRLGIKPLYYAEVDGRLLFASELKALLQSADVERRLSWNAVGRLFTFGCTPAWVMTEPPQEWPTSTTGPVWALITRLAKATSSSSEVNGFCTAIAFRPWACSSGMTLFQDEPSAKAPCTSTTVGRVSAMGDGVAAEAAVPRVRAAARASGARSFMAVSLGVGGPGRSR